MNSTARRSVWSFGRTDHWFLQIVLSVIAIGSIIGLVAGPIARWINGDPVPVDYSGKATIDALNRAGLKYDDVSTTVQVPVDGVGPRIWSLLPDLALCGLVLATLWLVFGVARDISRGNPFVPQNVRRIRTIAALALVGSIVVPMLTSMGQAMVVDGTALDALQPQGFSVTFPLWPIGAALVVAMIAEAFAAGDRMRDDLEGVI